MYVCVCVSVFRIEDHVLSAADVMELQESADADEASPYPVLRGCLRCVCVHASNKFMPAGNYRGLHSVSVTSGVS